MMPLIDFPSQRRFPINARQYMPIEQLVDGGGLKSIHGILTLKKQSGLQHVRDYPLYTGRQSR
jgi:hypothetical protein